MSIMDSLAAHALTALIERDTRIAEAELKRDGGDGCPLFYGAPEAYEEMAREAYYIAIQMQLTRENCRQQVESWARDCPDPWLLLLSKF